MRRVLFIAHYFPPTGGGGVQRPLKFVKYLPANGYLPLVLTSGIKAANRWSPADDSLSGEIPEMVPVYRPTLDESAAFASESRSDRGTRRRAALTALGSTIIGKERPELIFVTMSPFDDALVAAELARRHNLPWVADLRDPWALDEFQVYRSRWHRWRERRVMKDRLASAASIIMNTPEAMWAFQKAFPGLADKCAVSITNGFDPIDFSGGPLVRVPGKFNIVHSGYFHADHGLRQQRRQLEYRILGRTQAGVRLLPRSHYYLLKAIEKWTKELPEVTSTLAVVCLGVPSDVDQRLVDQSTVREVFTFAGYHSHAECLRYVMGADLLFLPMYHMPAGRRSSIVPGKTYEYLASGRPILATVPQGDALDFVRSAGTGSICAPEDVDALLTELKGAYTRWRQNEPALPQNRAYLKQFERESLTAKLAREFGRVLDTATSR